MTAIVVEFRSDFSLQRWLLHETRDEKKPGGSLGITTRAGALQMIVTVLERMNH